MTNRWPVLSFSEFLAPNTRPYTLGPTEDANLVGMRLYGRGPFHRELKTATSIRKKTHFVAHAGDVIYNKLFAWKGAFGIVPPELDGMFVSDKFPTYGLDADRVDPGFLRWFFRAPPLWEQARAMSTGSAALSKLTLNPPRFLDLRMPVPTVAEQRRIVARLDALAERIQEVDELRDVILRDADTVIANEEHRLFLGLKDVPVRPLGEVTSFLARGRQSKQGDSDHYLIKTQHVQLGRYVRTSMTLADYAAARVADGALVRPGDILVACSAAGCLGRVARYSDSGRRASTDTHVAIARPDHAEVDPDYLYIYLRSAQGQYQLRSRERGDWQREKVGFRLTELNVADLRAVPVPLPPLTDQRRIVEHLSAIRASLDEVGTLHASASDKLDILLPVILDKAFKGEL